MALTGLHHITAVTGALQQNLDFYVGVLGLRLAKRTVIQEEPTTYHLFYGDAVGTVGTGITFFDWPQFGYDRPGARNVIRTYFSVADAAALQWWATRFGKLGVSSRENTDFAGRRTLDFSDPEGQRLGLVAAGTYDRYQHWRASGITTAHGIQALHSVSLGVAEVEPTVDFLRDVFGYREVKSFRSNEPNEAEGVLLALGEGGVGRELTVIQRTDAQPGFRGIGSVHHVALTIPAGEGIEDWHARLVATGLKVTEIIRRFYFDSVYVRIPGGTLFELTTDGAGLSVDDDPDHIGEGLALPPFLEGWRAEIEAQLKPITVPDVRS